MACKFGTYIECSGEGNHCRVAPVMADSYKAREDFNHFIHTAMDEERRKDIHDETLVKLTDDVNRMIHEAENKFS
jgi:hypothetical protein